RIIVSTIGWWIVSLVPTHLFVLQANDVTGLVFSEVGNHVLPCIQDLHRNAEILVVPLRIRGRARLGIELVSSTGIWVTAQRSILGVARIGLRPEPHVLERRVTRAAARLSSVVERCEMDEVHSTVALPHPRRALDLLP